MKLKALTIRRTESYATPPSAIVGTVDLVDEGAGAQTIVLSPQSISKIMGLVQAEVQTRAIAQARASSEAFVEAIGELELMANPLLSNDEVDFS